MEIHQIVNVFQRQGMDISRQAVRFYERHKLIPSLSSRKPGEWREIGEMEVAFIRLVIGLRELGMNVKECRIIVDTIYRFRESAVGGEDTTRFRVTFGNLNSNMVSLMVKNDLFKNAQERERFIAVMEKLMRRLKRSEQHKLEFNGADVLLGFAKGTDKEKS